MSADFEQMSLFDLLVEPEVGEWVADHGQRLTFQEIADRVGQKIIMDKSTSSHKWYKVVRVERIVDVPEGRRLIYYDGHAQRGLVNEYWFTAERNPAVAYALS